MTDKAYKTVQRRVKALLDEWATGKNPRMLPLKHWLIHPTYQRGEIETEDGDVAAAQISAQWEYKKAEVDFNCPALEDLSDLELEQVVVHELCHPLINEMREYGTGEDDERFSMGRKHEEHVVTNLTLAFLQSKHGGYGKKGANG